MDFKTFLGEPAGQTWLQLAELALAFILSALIGLEREYRQKSAGLRTYTLVGFASALIMLVSKYGFTDVVEPGRIELDPSRIAAQIVSGIGFIGGGVIFVRKDLVRGLTTAATVWLTSAVGMACGAGLPILAIAVTGGHFIVISLFPALQRRLPQTRWAPSQLQISYLGGRGVLREVLAICTEHDFAVSRVQVEGNRNHLRSQAGAQQAKGHDKRWDDEAANVEDNLPSDTADPGDVVKLLIEVRGLKSIPKLAARISEIPGVVAVHAGDANFSSE